MARVNNLKVFDAPEAYGAWLTEHAHILDSDSRDRSASFYGDPINQAVEKLYTGDLTNLKAAQDVIDKLELSHLFANDMPILAPAIAGYMPCVPAYLAGHPQAMYARDTIENPSVNSPLTVWIDTTVSGGLSDKQLTNRGIATLAFVLAMEQIRPVDLYCVSAVSYNSRNQCDGAVVRVASRPMDLGRAVYMLTSKSYARRMCFAASCIINKGNSGSQGWPCNVYPEGDKYTDMMREFVGAEPDDVYLMGGIVYNDLMLTDPVAWVSQMVQKHSNNQMGNE